MSDIETLITQLLKAKENAEKRWDAYVKIFDDLAQDRAALQQALQDLARATQALAQAIQRLDRHVALAEIQLNDVAEFLNNLEEALNILAQKTRSRGEEPRPSQQG